MKVSLLMNLCDWFLDESHCPWRRLSSFMPSEVLLDPCRTWCPSSTCQAVCQLKESDSPALPQLVQCAVCALEFCSACKANWHPGQACQENNLPITSFLPGENRYWSLSVYLFTAPCLKFLFSEFLSQLFIFRSDSMFFFPLCSVLYESYTPVNTFIHISLLFKHLLELKWWSEW